VKERPGLFSGSMVRGILAGSKWQTRRIIKVHPSHAAEVATAKLDEDYGVFDHPRGACCRLETRDAGFWAHCKYGNVGDRIWVRETFARVDDHQGGQTIYRATDEASTPCHITWRPSIFMPRSASRITLEVTEVRVERLQDISGEDAKAEGVTAPRCGCEPCSRTSTMCPADASAHIEAFVALWESINGKRAPWTSNPLVWVIGFRNVET
jgi:hypothetical protein